MSKEINLSEGLIDLEGMSREEEQTLLSAIRSGDKALFERFIQSGTEAVSAIAEQCQSSEVSFQELFIAVREELIEATHVFDCASDERFMAYFRRRAEARVQDCYAHTAHFLPVDYRVIQLHDRYEEALLELYPHSEDREDFRVHHEGYLADYLGVTLEELRTMKNEYDMCKIVSLNSSVKLDKSLPDDYEDDDIDNRSPLIELLVDPATENAAADYLDDLMDFLSDDERYIVCARDGVLSVPARTDEQIAARLGVKTKRVETLYQAAIDKLRKAGTRTG